MQATNSVVPLQWIANEVGCDIRVRAAEDARLQALEDQIRELRRRAA
jgi:hypothetical protein